MVSAAPKDMKIQPKEPIETLGDVLTGGFKSEESESEEVKAEVALSKLGKKKG